VVIVNHWIMCGYLYLPTHFDQSGLQHMSFITNDTELIQWTEPFQRILHTLWNKRNITVGLPSLLVW